MSHQPDLDHVGPDIYVLIQLVPRIFFCTDEEGNTWLAPAFCQPNKTSDHSIIMLLRFGAKDATGIDASVLILQDKIQVSLMLLVLKTKIYLTP